MTTPRADPGSFRDRDGRVYLHGERVLRALSARALEAWHTVASRPFLRRSLEGGQVIATWPAELPAEGLAELGEGWAGALEHERVPFLSYPYEWTFGMLRDAALLQLDLLLAALADDVTLKDATPYNVQFRGCRPQFIDVASFEPWPAGEPWVGYLQFCQLFLFPLLLTAHRDLPFQPWLRGSVDGIDPADADRLFGGWRDRLRPGVFTHVYLQSRLQAKAADRQASVRTELARAGFRKELIVANVSRMRRLVAGLEWRRRASEWAQYATDNSYDEASRRAKEAFVRGAVESADHWPLVWDLGSNTGDYSRIASPRAGTVVAFDADPLAVERLYRELRRGGPENILPLTVNLVDPSPGLGWRGRERRPLEERGRPDLVLCLALVHHLVIRHHVPVPDLLDWLAGLGASLVVEYVSKDDPMVRKLLREKADRYADYEPEAFEQALTERFSVHRSVELPSGTRRLFFATPHGH